MSQSNRAQWIITPILDFMQTMPAFVYLIPAILFFSLGIVPGVVATIIFSMPPTVRFTNLGIRQVDGDLIEAANSFGSSVWQRLFKVRLASTNLYSNFFKIHQFLLMTNLLSLHTPQHVCILLEQHLEF